MEEELKPLVTKALATLEKHLEALSLDFADLAKEFADIKIESAPMIAKLVYASASGQLVAGLKEIILKIDFDKDGK